MTPLTPQELLQVNRFTLDHASDGAFCTDTEGRFHYVNESACRSLGRPAAELLQMRIFDVCSELTENLWNQLLKEVRARESFEFEFTLITKEGRSYPAELSVYRVTLVRQEMICGFFRDVNERKRLQQLKNEFVSTVSHELRTPMTIIRESVAQILDGLCGEVPAPQRDALQITLSGIDRLARMINDLLDISKMEAGKSSLRWDRWDLAQLVREVIDTFAARARERGLDLRANVPDRPMPVYADYDRMMQVLTNLIGNALKFSAHGSVEVSLEQNERETLCSVRDTGMGIAAEDLEKVFNKFEQLSQPAVTGEKGSGLGLSICKGIVELHQGTISVESEPGRGSTFRVNLPRRTAQELFQLRLVPELNKAAASDGHFSAIRFRVGGSPGQDESSVQFERILNELSDIARTQGVRRTDILVKDSDAIWVGLLNMNRKEATRIIDQVSQEYSHLLARRSLGANFALSISQCSYPEDSAAEADFMARLSNGIGD